MVSSGKHFVFNIFGKSFYSKQIIHTNIIALN